MATLLHSSWRFWLDRRENDLWCCNQNKGLSWAVGDGYRAIHKKSVKDRLLPIFAGRLYLLQTHPLGQKPWNTTYWRCWGPEANSRKNYCWIFEGRAQEAARPLQDCAGHSTGSEAAIDAMSQVFVEEGTDGILLIDASNAFNQMNRSVDLHNIQVTCKEMSLTEDRRGSLFAMEVRYYHDAVGSLGHALVLGQYICHDPELKDKHTRCY